MFVRIAAVALAGALVAGCQTGGGYAYDDSDPGQSPGLAAERARLVAFAATSEYPQDQAKDDLKAMAVVDSRSNQVTIYNATDQALRNAKVWVNGRFVGRVNEIPPNGKVTVSTSNLFDRDGVNLSRVNSPITQVELQTADEFHRLQGPVFE